MSLSDFMNPEFFKSPYLLLAMFLSPWKEQETINRLRRSIRNEPVDWGALVYLANFHLCSPLLYVQLRQDDLLAVLPEGLEEYLYSLYCLNVERNKGIITALEELLPAFQKEGIKTLLLKGAAVFCDDLYGDPGARMMLDVDILQPPEHKSAIIKILTNFGYREIIAPTMVPDGLPTDARHHHLPMFCKPDAPAGVEIHFKLIYGQASRGLSPVTAWEHSQPVLLNSRKAAILQPTERLLQNALHALVPHCEFIRAAISLQQVAEFACLIKKYEHDIDWDSWLKAGRQAGTARQMLIYLELTHRLMGIPVPSVLPRSMTTIPHIHRIITAGVLPADHCGRPKSLFKYSARQLTRLTVNLYYYLHLPAWVWKNVCYTDGQGNTLQRLRYFLKKALTKKSREKIRA
ncbi:nucleotidyltransferase family protein [Desulfobacterota bacterium M19]